MFSSGRVLRESIRSHRTGIHHNLNEKEATPASHHLTPNNWSRNDTTSAGQASVRDGHGHGVPAVDTRGNSYIASCNSIAPMQFASAKSFRESKLRHNTCINRRPDPPDPREGLRKIFNSQQDFTETKRYHDTELCHDNERKSRETGQILPWVPSPEKVRSSRYNGIGGSVIGREDPGSNKPPPEVWLPEKDDDGEPLHASHRHFSYRKKYHDTKKRTRPGLAPSETQPEDEVLESASGGHRSNKWYTRQKGLHHVGINAHQEDGEISPSMKPPQAVDPWDDAPHKSLKVFQSRKKHHSTAVRSRSQPPTQPTAAPGGWEEAYQPPERTVRRDWEGEGGGGGSHIPRSHSQGPTRSRSSGPTKQWGAGPTAPHRHPHYPEPQREQGPRGGGRGGGGYPVARDPEMTPTQVRRAEMEVRSRERDQRDSSRRAAMQERLANIERERAELSRMLAH